MTDTFDATAWVQGSNPDVNADFTGNDSTPSSFNANAWVGGGSIESIPMGMKQNTVPNQIKAGWDTGQALVQRGLQSLSESMQLGDSEFAQSVTELARKNEAEAARVPVEGLPDQVLRALGTVGVSAIPALATLPLSGTAAIAATLATSANMNLGDIKSKALEEDPDHVAGVGEVLSATALGSLEAIPLFRMKQALAPVGDAIETTLKQTLVKGAGKVGEAAVVGGLTEGAQDFATSALAYNFTGTEITDEALSKFVDQAIDEAIVGSILSGPLGVVEVTAETMQNNQAIKDMANFTVNEDGEMVLQEAVEDKFNNPSLFKRTLANLVGRTPDKILVSEIGGLVSTRNLIAKFVQNPLERKQQIGKSTVSVKGELISANLKSIAAPFLDADAKVAAQAVEARVTGKAPTDEKVKVAYEALNELLDNATFNEVAKAGFADDINWRNNKYIPLMNVDVNKVLSDPEGFAEAARQDVLKRGWSEEDAARNHQKALAYAGKLGANGFYHYGASQQTDVGAKFTKQINKVYQGELPANQLSKAIANVDVGKIKTNNPLEQERFLAELSQEFWTDYTTADVKGNIFAFVDSISERIAHVDTFGKNNEKYWKEVREVLSDASAKGITVTSDMVKHFTDMINISQRLPTATVSPKGRIIQNRIRAYENITKLPLALLPSIAEIMVVSERVGAVRTLSALGSMMKTRAINSVKKAVGKAPSMTVADDLGLSTAEAANIMSSRLGDDTFNPSLWEQRFFNLTGLPQFTEMLRITAATAAEKSFMRDAQTLTTTKNKAEIRHILTKFAEAGLDGQKVKNWYKEGADKSLPYYKDHIRMGLMNVVEDTVVNPKPIVRPAWTSDERFKLLAQMKSFATVFTNSVMRTWYDRMTTGGSAAQLTAAGKILPTVATMMVFQIYMGAVREWAKTGDIENWEDDEFLDHMFTGISYLGAGGFVVDPVKADTFGADASSTLLGPAISDFNKIMGGMGSILSGDVEPEDIVKSIVKNVTKSYPMSGIIHEEAGL